MKIKEIKRKISNKSITGFTKDYQRGYIAMRDFALSLLNQLDEEKEKEIPVVLNMLQIGLRKIRITLSIVFGNTIMIGEIMTHQINFIYGWIIM